MLTKMCIPILCIRIRRLIQQGEIYMENAAVLMQEAGFGWLYEIQSLI